VSPAQQAPVSDHMAAMDSVLRARFPEAEGSTLGLGSKGALGHSYPHHHPSQFPGGPATDRYEPYLHGIARGASMEQGVQGVGEDQMPEWFQGDGSKGIPSISDPIPEWLQGLAEPQSTADPAFGDTSTSMFGQGFFAGAGVNPAADGELGGEMDDSLESDAMAEPFNTLMELESPVLDQLASQQLTSFQAPGLDAFGAAASRHAPVDKAPGGRGSKFFPNAGTQSGPDELGRGTFSLFG